MAPWPEWSDVQSQRFSSLADRSASLNSSNAYDAAADADSDFLGLTHCRGLCEKLAPSLFCKNPIAWSF
jgi:hypothetical protein